MDSQLPTERFKVLSEIEQSIQDALALFNSKDLDLGIDQRYVVDDPIVSLHDPEKQDSENSFKSSKYCEKNPCENMSPTDRHPEAEEKQEFYDAVPFTGIKMSQESITLPFLQNPVQNTIEEMQRILNTKSNTPSPRVQSWPQQQLSATTQQQLSPTPQQLEPSPEEILNLYSQDLGINLTPNLSPRLDIHQSFNSYDNSLTKEIKKDKKSSKKIKQQKLNKEKKVEVTKGKSVKSEMMTNQDGKMRELMNIYGCGDKMKKHKSDSTIGSKSGVSRNASMKKLSTVNNTSSKASSIAASKKSKKLKYKITNDLDIHYSEGDSVPIEKSSRLSVKRKPKQKASNIKPVKKPTLKRKIVNKQSTDDDNLKLSKNHQTPSRIRNNESHNSKTKHYCDNNNGQKKQTNLRPLNYNSRKNISNQKTLTTNDIEDFGKNDSVTILDAIPNTKELTTKTTSVFPEVQSEKLSTTLNKKPLIMETEMDQNTLYKVVSEEKRLNKLVSTKESVHYHSYKMENKEMGCDFGNEVHPTQFHYTLPTQSSRSKEVERFLNGHYQHLPFVIGQSTNKSHNLWVNIQEALSLIKHNIPQTIEVHSVHKESDKDSERPMTVLSKLTAKSKRSHQQSCPVLMHDGLYDIPETSAEGEDAVKWEDHPDCLQANLDPNFYRPRCSCVPQGTLSYKKVLQQIFTGAEDSLERSRDDILDNGGDTYAGELRKVLITFTQEFEDLNNKYEQLLSDPDSSKEELQRLEMFLETKEEEIREIIARINEVKELNERSRGEFSNRGTNLEPYRSTTSVQLRQTLRRVQQFKEDIRSKPTTRHWSKISCAKSLY